MLVDELKIRVIAGHGGDGMVSFNKNMLSLGPSGATGGKGGDVYLEAVNDIGALGRLKSRKVFQAQDGKTGGHQFNDGPTGEDLVISVPVGTVVHNLVSKEDTELVKIGQRLLAAKGGKGGRGNFHFRSAINTSPKKSEPGQPGQKVNLRLELKLIADVGLIGLPNVGKSSLLNELTAAKSRVANYPFTTLEPHLGVYYELILADIPGIIEGASDGKGLGTKFLRHVERTRILIHLVSAESDNLADDYQIIRDELGKYSKALLEKKEYVFLSKSDLLSPADLKNKLAQLRKINKKAQSLSIHDWDSLESLKKLLNLIAEEKLQK